MDTVALVDVNGFGQHFKFADNEVQGWTQDTNTIINPFTVWRADSLVGLSGRRRRALPRTRMSGYHGAKYDRPNGPFANLRGRGHGFRNKRQCRLDVRFTNKIGHGQAPIPGFDGAAAMAAGQMFGNIIGFAHFNQMYFEVQMSGYYDQSASSTAAGQLLKILQQKVN